jgi:ammonium transporter Rh
MNKDSTGASQNHISKYWLYYFFICCEAVMIIFYSQFTAYGSDDGPRFGWDDASAQTHVNQYWPLFTDINVMIFIGFGFLLTVAKGFSWSAVGINFFLSAWTIQWAILCNGFWRAAFSNTWTDRIILDVKSFIESEYTAWSVIIAFGAVYGRLNFLQYLIMATFQTFFWALSWRITRTSFVANDLGGSMNVHAFGAFFGLAVSVIAGRKEAKKQTTYNTSLFALIGTLFLWVYFPSFNAGLSAGGNGQLRAVLNTILSLTGSCVMTCLFTPFLKNGKLHIEYILNATLAGGVIIASSADIILLPWVPFFLGCCAGVISVLGYEYVVPFFNNKLRIQDSAGVLSLHGITGVLGGFISAVVAGTANYTNFGGSLYTFFPAYNNVDPAKIRGRNIQGGYQLATVALVIALPIVAGVLVGFLLKVPCFTEVHTPFDDEEFWVLEYDQLAEHKKTDGNQVVEIRQSEAQI